MIKSLEIVVLLAYSGGTKLLWYHICVILCKVVY